MRYISNMTLLLSAVVMCVVVSSCGKDFQDDIDKLNAQHAGIYQRTTTLETQLSSMNTQLTQLSLLATAVEKGFYVTKVTSTSDGFELTLNNGHVLVLQNGTDKTLTAMPAVSMTQINGFFYWTINGTLLTDSSGHPVSASGRTPVMKYDYVTQQWLVSIDGGTTFQSVSIYASVLLDNEALLQVISTYASTHQDTFIDQNILYQIVSTCIRRNYEQLFNVTILDEVILSYIQQNYRRLFNYELLEQIFKQYNYEYATSQIKVEELTNVILEFIAQHKEIFQSNEVLYEIISGYLQMNKTTIFSDDLLLEVVNTFVSTHEDYIDMELLEEIIVTYLDEHKDVIVNNEVVEKLITDFITLNYQKIFTQDILAQLVNLYIERNYRTIFTETLIREVVNNYLENNNEFISEETIERIINKYIEEHETEVFSETFIKNVVEYYFRENFNVIIETGTIEDLIEAYVSTHWTEVFDETTIVKIVNSYINIYFENYFNETVITNILDNYFTLYRELITSTTQKFTGPITNVNVTESSDYVTITLENGQKVRLTVYGANDRLRNRVQSIVPLPKENVTILHELDNGYTLELYYMVTPASMAKVIADQAGNSKGVIVELKATDDACNISTISVNEVGYTEDGILNVYAVGKSNTSTGIPLAVALHVKETKSSDTDILSEFVPIGGGCSGIPKDPSTPTPSVASAAQNITIPYPNIQTSINECGECVATLSLTGIQHPLTGEWMNLFGTGLPTQNVWIDIDSKPKGNIVTNLEDNTQMVKNDIVFTVDNSGSMGEEADAIARDILSWAQTLTNKKLDVLFGVVGYGGNVGSEYDYLVKNYGVTGAMDLTSSNELSSYLSRSGKSGTNRTKGYYGTNASTLQSYAANERWNYAGGENGAQAIRFANEYFNFRPTANRIYVNFTDDCNFTGKNSEISVEFFNDRNKWPVSNGTIHSVISNGKDDLIKRASKYNSWELPWLISEYTGGTTMFVKSNASDLQLDKLTVSDAIMHSYTINFLVPKDLFDGKSHTIRITIISTDYKVIGVLSFPFTFKTA